MLVSRALLLVVGLVGLSSCSLTPPDQAGLGPPFREGDAAALIVRFYGWNSIQIMRPDTRENGFLPVLDREGVVARLRSLQKADRNLAVVVLGAMFSKTQEQEIIQQWHQIVDPCGYPRLVVLRAGFKDNINGLRVVYDSAMNRADAPPTDGPALRAFAQIAAAAGADGAHSPGAAVR